MHTSFRLALLTLLLLPAALPGSVIQFADRAVWRASAANFKTIDFDNYSEVRAPEGLVINDVTFDGEADPDLGVIGKSSTGTGFKDGKFVGDNSTFQIDDQSYGDNSIAPSAVLTPEPGKLPSLILCVALLLYGTRHRRRPRA